MDETYEGRSFISKAEYKFVDLEKEHIMQKILWKELSGKGRITFNTENENIEMGVGSDEIYLTPSELRKLRDNLDELVEDYERGTLTRKLIGNTLNNVSMGDGAVVVRGYGGTIEIGDYELEEQDTIDLLALLLWQIPTTDIAKAWKKAFGTNPTFVQTVLNAIQDTESK